jgi:hypothetical protein
MTHISKKRESAKKRNHKKWVRKNSRNTKKKRLTTIDSPHGQIQGISCAKWQINR